MTAVEEQLRALAALPVSLPPGAAHAAWTTGRRQRRRRVSVAISAAVLATGIAAGIFAAHPALAEMNGCAGTTASAQVTSSQSGPPCAPAIDANAPRRVTALLAPH